MKRLIKGYSQFKQGNRPAGRIAKLYFDSNLQEYQVVFYTGNVKHVNADYYTHMRDDAVDTAMAFIRGQE